MTGKAYMSVTLNATDEKCEIMGPFTHPNISCIDATLVSMNIPFVFYQLILNGKSYVDGALANPYPVDFLDDGQTNILGLYMKSINRITATPIVEAKPRSSIIHRIEEPSSTPLTITTYMHKIVQSLMEQRRSAIIQHCSNHCKHVCLQSDTQDGIGFGITAEIKADLLVRGFNAGKDFLYKISNDTYTGPIIAPILKYTYPTYHLCQEPIINETRPQPSSSNKVSENILNAMASEE